MRGISAVIAVVLIVAVTVALSIAIALWMTGIVSSTYNTRTVKLAVIRADAGMNTTWIMVKNAGGYEATIDFIRVNNKYTLRILSAYELGTNESKVIIDKDTGEVTGVVVGPGETVIIYAATPPGFSFEPGVIYAIEIHTTIGQSEIYHVEVHMRRPASLAHYTPPPPPPSGRGILWLAPSRSYRIAVAINSQYNRTGYPVPLRIDFNQLNATSHVDGSSFLVFYYDNYLSEWRQTVFSVVEVADNVYWFVVKLNLTDNNSTIIHIYFNYGGTASPGTYYNTTYPVKFPLPVNTGGGYEQAHVQFDYEVPSGNSYGNNYYILLLAPRGSVLPYDDSTTSTYSTWLSDDSYYSSSIPFNFHFYAQTITTIYPGSNGFLTLSGSIDWSDTLSELQGRAMIAPYWNDLKDYTSDTVYENTGTLFGGIQYKTWYWKTGYFGEDHDGDVRFRVYLFSDGTIGYHIYSIVTGTRGGYTSGISDGSTYRWISPISSSSGYYGVIGSEGDIMNYDFIYIYLPTLSYSVSTVTAHT